MTRVKGTTHPIRQHISAPPLWTERNNGASGFLTLYTPDINYMIMLRRPLFTSFDAKLLSLDLDQISILTQSAHPQLVVFSLFGINQICVLCKWFLLLYKQISNYQLSKLLQMASFKMHTSCVCAAWITYENENKLK